MQATEQLCKINTNIEKLNVKDLSHRPLLLVLTNRSQHKFTKMGVFSEEVNAVRCNTRRRTEMVETAFVASCLLLTREQANKLNLYNLKASVSKP